MTARQRRSREVRPKVSRVDRASCHTGWHVTNSQHIQTQESCLFWKFCREIMFCGIMSFSVVMPLTMFKQRDTLLPQRSPAAPVLGRSISPKNRASSSGTTVSCQSCQRWHGGDRAPVARVLRVRRPRKRRDDSGFPAGWDVWRVTTFLSPPRLKTIALEAGRSEPPLDVPPTVPAI